MEYETRRKPSCTLPLPATGDNIAPGRVFTKEYEAKLAADEAKFADEQEERQIKWYGRGWSSEA